MAHQTDLQTLELRQIIESGIKIFDFEYPKIKIPTFEDDFCRHFYFRQIGAETIARWKFMLQDKLNLIAGYYNDLIDSSKIDFDYLSDYEMTTTKTSEVENSGTNTATTSTEGETGTTVTDKGSSKTDMSHGLKVDTTSSSTDSNNETIKQSDTPMSKVSNLTDGYLTNVSQTTGNNTTSGTNSVTNSGTDKTSVTTENTNTGTSNSTTTGTANSTTTGNSRSNESMTIKGHTKNRLDYIKKYRELIINIEAQIFEDMEDLFLLLY